ncbi:MAG TPA: trypsin-like peptidase domain-containing protein [Blastocatellia bacterium]|jgi:S1-C subfamily serine protease|nr:trypsin-like peptidase domain-containing protein [Blastocatellia bacterium]
MKYEKGFHEKGDRGAMFASSFLAEPRGAALGAVLIAFLLTSSPVWPNAAGSALFLLPGPSGQYRKPSDRPQQKDSLPEKGWTAEEKAIVRNAVPSVGQVMAKTGPGRNLSYRGSAVVLREDGLVVTNHHVIYDKESEKIYEGLYLRLYDEKMNGVSDASYRLEVVLVDRPRDLALLRVIEAGGRNSAGANLNFASLELGDERKLELLDDLVVIGFPEKGGSSPTLSVGVVEGIDLKGGWIKTDARLLHGNSGGAAVNREGKLIGIATKVVADETDNNIRLGMIGYLRSAGLVRQMLMKAPELDGYKERGSPSTQAGAVSAKRDPGPEAQATPVRGVVKDAITGDPIVGARVGLLVAGGDLNVANIITWGGTNAEGMFELEKPVLPGTYTLRVKVLGDFAYAPYSREVEVRPGVPLMIELKLAGKQ